MTIYQVLCLIGVPALILAVFKLPVEPNQA